ncbi:TonB-dependent receptor [Sunxiuqinia sp. A32]|uniref:TonB-dependent receptor n=1 Tax=Sunxiuqinia sp. A32 TaxID=3461496 RepID=UPI0040464CF5
MKITFFLLLIAFVQVSATSFSQSAKLNLNMENVKLSSLLDRIEETSDYRFFYDSKAVDLTKTVSVESKDSDLEKILEKVLGENLSFEMVGKNIVVIKNAGNENTLTDNDQRSSISGKITDSSGTSLPGVTVVIKGTTNGTITDVDGRYNLNNVQRDATLVLSFVGMKTQEIPVDGRNTIDVVMTEDAIGIEEVVAVGYGIQKKESLTGSIAAIKGETLQRSTSVNFSNALAGQLPGLVAITRTGEPGNDGSTLRIRGANTLGDNSPLVVVDGIANRSLERLDPATIESVTVLKDASAAIYGAQAANGVILVTTKRGASGKPTIQLNLSQGWNNPTVLPKMTGSPLYAEIANEIADAGGYQRFFTEEDIQLFKDGSDPWGHPNTDWFKEVIKDNSPQRYGNLTLSGGADRIKYFVSVGSNFQDGLYKNSAIYYSQTDFRSNLDAKINDNIRISFDVAGRQENRNYSGVGGNGGEGAQNIFWALNRAFPYMNAYWPNGLPGPDIEYGANPAVLVTDITGYDKEKTYVMESNMKLVIDIPWVEGLSLTGNVAIDKTFKNRKRFQKPWTLYTWDGTSMDENNEPLLAGVKRGFTDPRLQQWMSDEAKTTINGLINYERTFGLKHDIKILLGAERITGDLMDFWAFRRYYTSDILDQMSAGGDLSKDNGGAGRETIRQNYFGRVNYAFDSKYLAEFVWRYDGSYIFAPGKRYGFFPGISLGYRISEENFWKDNFAFINDMKIRGSWGKTGNDRIDPYQFMTTYGYNSAYLFNETNKQKTLAALRIPNKDITWEVANQSNIGFDAQLLDNKLMASFEYFYNLRTNILWYRNASVPASTGLSLPRENIGEVVNKGYEFQLSYHNNIGDFKYQVSANGAFSKNHIKFWDETPGVPDYQKSTGNPMNARLYYQAIGVFVDQAAVDAYPHWPGARPGDIIFEDVNKDGEINGLDRVRSDKTTIPTFTGGFNVDFQYKNFYANALFQGAAGAERSYRIFSGAPGNGNFLYNEVKDRWTPENPSSTHPRANNRSLEYWMTDGEPNNTYYVRSSDYLRLKNIEIGYNVPGTIVKKMGMEALRFYVSGQNFLTFTKMKDFDPESPDDAPGSIWVNSQVYPLNKTTTIGLTLTF